MSALPSVNGCVSDDIHEMLEEADMVCHFQAMLLDPPPSCGYLAGIAVSTP